MSGDQGEFELGLIRVHCFACPTFVEAATPDEAHDRMEEHYGAEHAAFIADLAAGIRP